MLLRRPYVVVRVFCPSVCTVRPFAACYGSNSGDLYRHRRQPVIENETVATLSGSEPLTVVRVAKTAADYRSIAVSSVATDKAAWLGNRGGSFDSYRYIRSDELLHG